MISRHRDASTDTGFTLQALNALRPSYPPGYDLFTEPEIARLRFVCWLIESPGWDSAMDQPITIAKRAKAT